MPRERLPDRRKSTTQKVHVVDPDAGPTTFYATFGEYPDGRLGEVFLDCHKEGTFSRGVMSALARVISIALQVGAEPGDIVKALRHLNFPPRGEVQGSAAVLKCTSVVDWLAQEIEAFCAPREIVDKPG